ncbi:hypothetical protein [Rhizobium sp. RHZ01]|uniref:DUF6894 family protein n=1 Tax=Rhizobium sp. RHZ01 TaxID=2769304 RepID=UPI00178374B6|nr:hypothetical protein [Rhizobium sp. RHZ01]MBD9449639.1 hypothetical protein [Rhizobium sp. RHZ01]
MKFFFHIRDMDGYERDEDGVELPSLSDAINEANEAAREMVAELVMQSEEIDGRAFEIANEDGEIVRTVAFRDVIKLD